MDVIRQFPILVTYTYRPDDDKMDTSAVDDDVSSTHSSLSNGMDDEDGNTHHKSKGGRRNSDDDRGDEGLKGYSFWCVVGLGEVVARDAAEREGTGGWAN